MTPITKKYKDFVIVNPETINENIDPITPQVSRFYEPLKPHWLYVLKLEHDKFYVGYTGKANPYDRILQHGVDGDGAKWTQKYKPIDVLEIRDIGMSTKTEAKALEQNLTWVYMTKYGANSVRGGIINYPGIVLKVGDRVIMGYQFIYFAAALFLIFENAYLLLLYLQGKW